MTTVSRKAAADNIIKIILGQRQFFKNIFLIKREDIQR